MAATIDFLSRSKLEYPAGSGRMAFIDQSPDVRSERFNFLDQAWIRVDRGVVVRTGGFLSSGQGRRVHRVQLPAVGDMVYQGLPLAALIAPDNQKTFIPAPVTGRILEVNRKLVPKPDPLWQDPCERGWIALLQPDDLFQDMLATRKRTVILAGANRKPNPDLHRRLTRLGCRVIAIRSLDYVFQLVRDNRARVLVLDAGSQANHVAQVIKWFGFAAPEIKIVLAGSPAAVREAAGFANHAVPYPLETYDDSRITDTLQACFQPADRRTRPVEASGAGRFRLFRFSRGWNIWVSLIVSPQVGRQHEGLEKELDRLACEHDCLLETGSAQDQSGFPGIQQEALCSSRVLVLDIHDSGQIPGSLNMQIPDGPERLGLPEGKLLNLRVQPTGLGFRQEVFDPHTTRSLARQVFAEISHSLGLGKQTSSSPAALPVH